MPDDRDDRAAWEAVASFWHERMGEGNDFVDLLIWPHVSELLPARPGSRILDVGCGNGLYARRLAAEGARVLAVDYSSQMIARAQASTRLDSIEYRVLDAADPESLGSLPRESFDAALSTMVLMDMNDIGPLFRALPRLLSPRGVFVFATAHPSFNSPHASLEGDATDPTRSERATVRVAAYQTSTRTLDVAIRGQPAETVFFHRSLSELLGEAFEAGLVLDALEESCFPPEHPNGPRPDSWGGRHHEFPAVLLGRLRRGRQMDGGI